MTLRPKCSKIILVACAVGTYLDAASDTCKPCPMGTYQSEAGQLQCTSCPSIAGQAGVTQAPGARSAADCKGKNIFLITYLNR